MASFSVSGAASGVTSVKSAQGGGPVAARAPTVEEFFNGLSKDTMHLVDEFYSENTHFLDPVVDLKGRAAVRKYYENLYDNLISIRFEFSGEITQGDEKVALWTMILRHKKLKGGDEVRVIGNSHFKFDPKTGQALYHRDYFDMGEFIYEGLPVVGSVIRFVKNKMRQTN
jgi:hypothetical protein